ncbi:MAG: tRNA lysidine(34) synthetase TilS [Thermodesulfovibrionia bacterium]
MNTLQKVINTIKIYSMVSPGDGILIALSGGADSVCLTIILDKLRDIFNLSLSAIYINHGLRPDETIKEEGFCKRLCGSLGINLYTHAVDVKGYAEEKGMGLQESARELRYQVLYDYARMMDAQRIAVGHNADDQVETILMRLIRGTGRKGLSGIPPVRGKVIRPLIEIERREIEEFLNQQMPPVEFMIDSSNLKTDYLRNWLRLKIIPELKSKNPNLIMTMSRSSLIISEEDAYLDTIVSKTMLRLVSKRDDESIELFLLPLECLERPIMRRVLIKAIGEIVHFRGIDFVHIEEIIRLIKDGKSGDMVMLPKGLRVIKGYSTLLLSIKGRVEVQPRLLDAPQELHLNEINTIIKTRVSTVMDNDADGRTKAVFDLDRLRLPLRVRKRREGDYFCPAGMSGKRKKLQDFFVDEKVAREERDSIPIIVSDNDIIWVTGYRMDERFKADAKTERFLVIEAINCGGQS